MTKTENKRLIGEKFWGWGGSNTKVEKISLYKLLNNTIEFVFVLYFTGQSSKGCWWKKPRYWSVALMKPTSFDLTIA